MCGIVGMARLTGTGLSDTEWLTEAVHLIAHRGPDSRGLFRSQDDRVLMGHRRLAIIDTSAAGNQPMQTTDGRFSVVLNGEIYNFRALREDLLRRGHRFNSQSDTEVVVNGYVEWGTGLFGRLSGAFAIGIYDAARGLLVLGRDRFGEKPLYTHCTADTFTFGSEVKSIMCRPGFSRTVDLEALDSFLYVGYGLSDRSLVSGISKLRPAHYSVFDVGTGKYFETAYWSPPNLKPSAASRSLEDLVDEMEVRLDAAVHSQMVSDVPIGVLLSGGLDSSLITAMAARHESALKTFTVRFPEFPDIDETSHARLIAQHFGTDHTELDASSITPDIFSKIASQMDDPIADSSIIPTYLVSALVKDHCTVALGGDGGDELFGGYPRYSKLLEMQARFGFVPVHLRRTAAKTLLDYLPTGFKGTNFVQSAGLDFKGTAPVMNVLFSQRHRNQLVPALRDLPIRAESLEQIMSNGGADSVDTAIRHDLLRYMPEDILVKVDRASMMNSLEVRAPFLDVALAEFALSQVATKYKTTSSSRKILLRELSRRVLPVDFDQIRKQGFSVPLGNWLQEAPLWTTFMHSTIFDAPSIFKGNPSARRVWKDQQEGRSNSERLFALATLSLWLDTNKIRIAAV